MTLLLAACGGDNLENLSTDAGAPDASLADAMTDATSPDSGPDGASDGGKDAMTTDSAAASCTDGVKDGDETAVDCGGSCSTKCADGSTCNTGTDCTDAVCTSGVCTAPTCTDGTKNGTETGTDCGGSCSTKCALGGGCATGADCTTLSCQMGVCVAASCTDGIKDEGESDTDCGGTSTCARCPDGDKCTAPTDCVDDVCSLAGTCSPASCTDGVKNGTETGTDCGGATCDAAGHTCPDSSACATAADCTDGVCTIPTGATTGTCAAPTCTDGVKNGLETATDCGGLTCDTLGDTCADSSACVTGADCKDKICAPATETCSAATCTDGVQNGNESGVDCGGTSTCGTCSIGKGCTMDSDCNTGACTILTGQTSGVCGLGGGTDGALTAALGTTTINNLEYTASGVAGTNTLTVPTTAALVVGQKVLVYQTQGTGAGTYEYGTVSATATGMATLAGKLAHSYTLPGAQVVVVPQYTTVSVGAGATLTAAAWNGTTGGVLAFEASGAVTVAAAAAPLAGGIITMAGNGFRGASDTTGVCASGTPNRYPACKTTPYANGMYGESPTGPSAASVNTIVGTSTIEFGSNNGTGGGAGVVGQDCASGAGGGYALAGGNGTNGINLTGGNCVPAGGNGGGIAGIKFATTDLTSEFVYGGAGGQGGIDEDGAYPGSGGNGGGGIVISAASFTVGTGGSITASGALGGVGVNTGAALCTKGAGAGMGNGGGGAGGPIRIATTGALSIGTGQVVSKGGTGPTTSNNCSVTTSPGGTGSVGVVQLRAGGALTGTSTPATN